VNLRNELHDPYSLAMTKIGDDASGRAHLAVRDFCRMAVQSLADAASEVTRDLGLLHHRQTLLLSGMPQRDVSAVAGGKKPPGHPAARRSCVRKLLGH
jgi:hypothetical protein